MFVIRYKYGKGTGIGALSCQTDTLDCLSRAVDRCNKRGEEILQIEVYGGAKDITAIGGKNWKTYKGYPLVYRKDS